MVEFLVGSHVGGEVCRDVRHLALNVGLNAQVVLWVQALSSLSDSNPLLSWEERGGGRSEISKPLMEELATSPYS